MSIRETCLNLAVFLAAIFLFLDSVDGRRFRIVGGRRASSLEFPYQVELERMSRHWCGGSVIDRKWILTAAHCVKAYEALKPVPPMVLQVRVGNDVTGTGGYLYSISEIIPHEKYNDTAAMDQYDIALLRLAKPLKLNDRVKIVKLAKKEPKEGSLGWVTGFGWQEVMRSSKLKRNLMAVEIPVVSLQKCRTILQGVADDILCAGFEKGHKDACTGDSGGPYVVNKEQVGIVAWGSGCGREGIPGAYTNVPFHLDWIMSKMSKKRREAGCGK